MVEAKPAADLDSSAAGQVIDFSKVKKKKVMNKRKQQLNTVATLKKMSGFILYLCICNSTRTLSGCHTCKNKKRVCVCFKYEIHYLPSCVLYVLPMSLHHIHQMIRFSLIP